MQPPSPYIAWFDSIPIKLPESVLNLKLCRWCKCPVDYSDYSESFINNTLYHLLDEDEEACNVIRRILMGARS